MKIVGIILLVLGVTFELLFIMIGRASVPPSALAIAAAMIAAGWKCLAVAKAASSASLDPACSPTSALPLTPEMAAYLDAYRARGRRIVFRIAGGLFGACLAGGIVIDATVLRESAVHALPILAILGIAGAAIVWLVWLSLGERLARRDRRSGSYLRSTGTVTIRAVPGGNLVRVGDHAFVLDECPAAKLLRSLPAATVDHSPHAHVVFAVRDFSGNTLYSVPAR